MPRITSPFWNDDGCTLHPESDPTVLCKQCLSEKHPGIAVWLSDEEDDILDVSTREDFMTLVFTNYPDHDWLISRIVYEEDDDFDDDDRIVEDDNFVPEEEDEGEFE